MIAIEPASLSILWNPAIDPWTRWNPPAPLPWFGRLDWICFYSLAMANLMLARPMLVGQAFRGRYPVVF